MVFNQFGFRNEAVIMRCSKLFTFLFLTLDALQARNSVGIKTILFVTCVSAFAGSCRDTSYESPESAIEVLDNFERAVKKNNFESLMAMYPSKEVYTELVDRNPELSNSELREKALNQYDVNRIRFQERLETWYEVHQGSIHPSADWPEMEAYRTSERPGMPGILRYEATLYAPLIDGSFETLDFSGFALDERWYLSGIRSKVNR